MPMFPTLKTRLIAAFIAAMSAALSACASQQSLGSPPETGALQPASADKTPSLVTANDRDADCKTLRGRMQVSILDLNAKTSTPKTTGLSRAMQSSVSSVLGGPKTGVNPDGDIERQRARLHALNQLLKEQDCKTFDLDKELIAQAR